MTQNSHEEIAMNIDSVTAKISELYTNAATAVDMLKITSTNRKTTSKHKHTNRPWFDSDCKNKRITYMKAKNKYRRCNSDVNIAELKVASKSYKKDT